MFVRPRTVALPLLALVLGTCHTRRVPDDDVRGGHGIEARDGGFVLSGDVLADGRGSVLGAIEGKIPGLRVRRNVRGCPEVNMRQQTPLLGAVAPRVYVDGILSADTCILDSLRSHDVNSVEVYPQGFTRRSGYAGHAHGLILVFMREPARTGPDTLGRPGP